MSKKKRSGSCNFLILYKKVLRPMCCRSRLMLLLVFSIFLCLLRISLLSLRPGSVHIGDYYYVHNVSYREEVAKLPKEFTVFKNRRLKASGKCTNKDISISQSPVMSPGIPEFIVQIVNTCMSGCSPSNIHLHCGWFASAKMVNPTVFRRVADDDCLVNGGRPLKSSQVIRFTYSNTFLYPLSFKSASFC